MSASPSAASVAPAAAPSLISDAYRAMQAELHRNPNYGVASEHWAPMVAQVASQVRPRRLLDYGAGKGRLGRAIKPLLDFPYQLIEYDPAIPAMAATPPPCEMVACLDVLEHIEPDLIDAVLDDLKRVTLVVGVFTFATGPAVKVLPDGRNAHLIQEGPEWWLSHLFRRFAVKQFMDQNESFWVIVTPRKVG